MSQHKTIKRQKNWNFIDRFLSHWRTSFIHKYISPESVVADIGCGQEGDLLLSISHKIKKGYGFDFNLKENQKIGNIELTNEDFLETIGGKYNVVLLIAVLEHLPHPEEVDRMINAIHSRLESGGYFIMTTPDKRGQWLLEFLAYKVHMINEEEIRDHKHCFNKSELLDLMEEHHFSHVQHSHFQLGLNNLIVCRK